MNMYNSPATRARTCVSMKAAMWLFSKGGPCGPAPSARERLEERMAAIRESKRRLNEKITTLTARELPAHEKAIRVTLVPTGNPPHIPRIKLLYAKQLALQLKTNQSDLVRLMGVAMGLDHVIRTMDQLASDMDITAALRHTAGIAEYCAQALRHAPMGKTVQRFERSMARVRDASAVSRETMRDFAQESLADAEADAEAEAESMLGEDENVDSGVNPIDAILVSCVPDLHRWVENPDDLRAPPPMPDVPIGGPGGGSGSGSGGRPMPPAMVDVDLGRPGDGGIEENVFIAERLRKLREEIWGEPGGGNDGGNGKGEE